MSSGRPTVLAIHDEGDALDLLTRLFEASGFDVVTAVTGFRAQAYLEGDRRFDVVVAPWDVAHPVGGDVYRWALQRRYDLRDQFVFVAQDVPAEFDRLVAGRCLAVSMVRPNEVVRVAVATIKRRHQLEAARDAAVADLDGDNKPTLLLVDDDPSLLAAMAGLLSDSGYNVTRVDSGNDAVRHLQQEEFEAIVIDWHMDEGSGADLYRWISAERPWLADRIVFLSSEESDDTSMVAPGRPTFRKGQDSHGLRTVLREIIREVRHMNSQA